MLRPKLNRVWTSANSALRRDPGDAKYIQGWVAEIPTFQVLNYLQYKIDTTILAQAERGIFEWGNDIQYGLGSIVWNEVDKKIYVSIATTPDKTKTPNTNPTQWSPSSIQIPRADYDTIVAAINAHIADVTGNPHKLTAGRLGAYNKSETDAIVAQYRALVATHSNNKNNPHGVTAEQVGAVPITGGTYTGNVAMNGDVYFDSGKVNKIYKQSTGLYLQSGAAVLGISNDGTGKLGPSPTSTSNIVTEATFPALKAAQEPKFATPMPNYWVDFMFNINIHIGTGILETDFTPTYSSAWAHLIISAANIGANANITQKGLSNIGQGTIVADIMSGANPVDETTAAFIFGMSKMYIYTTGSGRITASYINSSGVNTSVSSAAGVINGAKYFRIAATFSADTIKLFVNGELVGQASLSSTTNQAQDLYFGVRKKAAGFDRDWRISNLRMWYAVALTDEQVANL